MENNEPINSTVIKAEDYYGNNCFKDSFMQQNIQSRGPKGYVQIYDLLPDGSKKLYAHSNLVVYQGRAAVASRMFNIRNTNISPLQSNYISWFGVGDQGAPSDPLNPVPPQNSDTGLTHQVPFGTNASYADLQGGTYYKHPFDSVEFVMDTSNNNAWLINKVTITIGTDDANGYNLSEAGLYLSDSNASGYGGPFYIYSKITFPTLVKTTARQLIFIWFIYF